jgi:hypothetical protein
LCFFSDYENNGKRFRVGVGSAHLHISRTVERERELLGCRLTAAAEVHRQRYVQEKKEEEYQSRRRRDGRWW